MKTEELFQVTKVLGEISDFIRELDEISALMITTAADRLLQILEANVDQLDIINKVENIQSSAIVFEGSNCKPYKAIPKNIDANTMLEIDDIINQVQSKLTKAE